VHTVAISPKYSKQKLLKVWKVYSFLYSLFLWGGVRGQQPSEDSKYLMVYVVVEK